MWEEEHSPGETGERARERKGERRIMVRRGGVDDEQESMGLEW